MSKIILLIFILISVTTHAKKLCPDKIMGLKREIPLAVDPTYFIRVDTNTNKIFMSGDCVLSLKDGKCISEGRTWEPYPISGYGLVTIPNCRVISENTMAAMCFYDQKTFKNQDDSKAVFEDKELIGYYQSIGFLNKSKDSAKVRVLTYYGYFRDYNIQSGKVTPAGGVKAWCPNIKSEVGLKTPMLSKDGKTISAWHHEQRKTYLYSMDESGKCSAIQQLDFMIGKMDFDYQNKYAAFHSTTNTAGKAIDNADGESPLLKNNDTYPNQQIFVMDLKTRKIHKLSFGNQNIYYPHFGENGLLYALKLDHQTKKYSLLEINVEEALKLSDTEGSVCLDCTTKQQEAFFKLGCEY